MENKRLPFYRAVRDSAELIGFVLQLLYQRLLFTKGTVGTWKIIKINKHRTGVADPECLSRIPGQKILDPDPHKII